MYCGCDLVVDVSVDVGVVWMWFEMWVWRGYGGGGVDVALDVVRMWCWMWVGVFVDDDFFCASDIVGENSETVTVAKGREVLVFGTVPGVFMRIPHPKPLARSL